MRLLVGMSGATGAVYGIRLLEVLRERPDIETHLIISGPARLIIAYETDYGQAQVEALADRVYPAHDIGAAPSSGSFPVDGMVVVPCSVRTLSAIAHSLGDNLLVRAADVQLKERRRLVLVVRETPLHLGHIRLMVEATEIGATIMPPMPAFYHRPTSIADIVDQTVGRILDQFNIENTLFPRWEGARPPK